MVCTREAERIGFGVRSECRRDFFEAFEHSGVRTTEVETDVLGPAEKRAVGEEKFGGFLEVEGWVWVAERAGVEPSEVGGVAMAHGEAGAAGADEVDEGIAVLFEVSEQFQAPWFAVAVGGLSGVVGEGVDFGEGVAAGGAEFATDGFVRDDRVGVTEAGDVPCLAGREQGDGALGETFGEIQRREMRGGGFIEDEVAVDFIGDEDEVMALAEIGDPLDFRRGKRTAEGVLRIAEEKQAGGRGDSAFHGLPIEAPVFSC